MTGRWLAVWSRGLRSEPGRSLGVALLILVTVFIAASVPRLLAQASDSALHSELAAAPSTVRNLELVQEGRIPADTTDPTDPLRLVETAGTGLELRYPEPLPSVLAGNGLVVDTPLWHPSAGTALDSVLNLRIQQDVAAHIKLVSGHLPTGTTKTIPDPTPGANKENTLLVLEVAMSSQTASKLGLAIGGRLILPTEPSDPLAANRGVRLAADLVGTYDVIDPADPFWMGDSSVDHTLHLRAVELRRVRRWDDAHRARGVSRADDRDPAIRPADDLSLALVRRDGRPPVERARCAGRGPPPGRDDLSPRDTDPEQRRPLRGSGPDEPGLAPERAPRPDHRPPGPLAGGCHDPHDPVDRGRPRDPGQPGPRGRDDRPPATRRAGRRRDDGARPPARSPRRS